MTTPAEVEARIGYAFADPALLEEALTHTSHAHERGGRHNERVEFLGDAVLQLAVSSALFARLPAASEGQLSRARAKLVNTATLAEVGLELGLGEALRLGRGEEATGGRTRDSVLAAAVEAVLGAVFLEAGFERAREVALAAIATRVEALVEAAPDAPSPFKDPRTRLQELTQSRSRTTPTYRELSREGPAHEPVFTVEVLVGSEPIGRGVGNTKRAAARAAAEAALVALEPSRRAPEGG
jgi:ribonuclease-3